MGMVMMDFTTQGVFLLGWQPEELGLGFGDGCLVLWFCSDILVMVFFSCLVLSFLFPNLIWLLITLLPLHG